MSTPQCSLRVHQDEENLTFQVLGQATVLQGLPLRRLAEKYLSNGGTSIRVDLRLCRWLDSTFVGTLLLLFRTARELILLSPSPECRKILHQMGVDRICCLREEELPTNGWTEIEQATECIGDFRENVLQAHEQLAELPGPTGDTFRNLVRDVEDSRVGRSAR